MCTWCRVKYPGLSISYIIISLIQYKKIVNSLVASDDFWLTELALFQKELLRTTPNTHTLSPCNHPFYQDNNESSSFKIFSPSPCLKKPDNWDLIYASKLRNLQSTFKANTTTNNEKVTDNWRQPSPVGIWRLTTAFSAWCHLSSRKKLCQM